MRRIVVLFVVALLLATMSGLGSARVSVAQDGRVGVPPPEDCTGEPATAAEIVDAVRTGGNAQDAEAIPLIGIEESELPEGTEPDPDDLAAAIDVVWTATACANAGDFARFFGHLTPAAMYALLDGLFMALGGSLADVSESELADLETNLEVGLMADPEALVGDDRAHIDAIRGARVLPDGRILLLADGRLVLDGTGYMIMVEVDGVWKADRLGQIGDVDMLGIGSGDLSLAGDDGAVAVVTPEVIKTTPVAGSGGGTSAGTIDDLPEAVTLDAITTLVYHEITQWEVAPDYYGEQAPILSDDGATISFARSPASGDLATPNRVFAMNADGTGEREIDSYVPLCYCGSNIDISADGSRVLVSDSVQVRVANGDGSGAVSLLVLASNEINGARISGDGSTVVIRVYRDTLVKDTVDPVPAGYYALNADGSGMRMLTGVPELAALFGVPMEGIPTAGPSYALDVSYDGRQLVASVMVEPISGGGNQALIHIDGDRHLRALTEIVNFVTNVAISADGSTAAYVLTHHDTAIGEAGVVDLGSGAVTVLTNTTAEPPGINQSLTGSYERIQLTADGSLLLLGGTGLLIDTSSGSMISLSAVDGAWGSGDQPHLTNGRTDFGTMDATGTRFLYLVPNVANVNQAVILELNPASTGEAPSLDDVTLDRDSVGINRNGFATLTASVDAETDYLRIGVVLLRDGRPDSNMSRYGVQLVDDGVSGGDVTAGDGVFTIDSIGADCCAIPGPRTIRVKAETIDADGYRHATAVDVRGLSVTE